MRQVRRLRGPPRNHLRKQRNQPWKSRVFFLHCLLGNSAQKLGHFTVHETEQPYSVKMCTDSQTDWILYLLHPLPFLCYSGKALKKSTVEEKRGRSIITVHGFLEILYTQWNMEEKQEEDCFENIIEVVVSLNSIIFVVNGNGRICDVHKRRSLYMNIHWSLEIKKENEHINLVFEERHKEEK